ncbi:hypothetical protein P8C59_004181 [Phyllachora maydis]|uniref:Protein transport protein sec16 n=1 Tax=Phyllachora maydis TaxID=1825666 RepID=A0AAD9I3J1_9PEZI|nr:hypothetical protein P8C59_004181 [Phyllachora maydis]
MDAPHASWHPALMPNTMADVVLHEPTTHTATPSDAIPDEYRDTWEAAPAREEDDREGRGQAQVHEHDGWFPDYGTGNAARQGSKPPSASQQHKSSMSFARTVSHDVNWTDDEDPESNVAHTESGEGDDDDFFRQLCPADQTAPVPEAAPAHSDKIAVSAGADELDAEAGIEDLDAKWKELLADDDTECFLLDESADEKKEMDPAAFFGDDDEGFLEDDEAPVPAPVQPAVGATQATTAQDEFGLANGRAKRPPVAYSSYPNPASVPPPAAALAYAAAPPARPQPSKEHSFVTAKGGYQSPYDLPMEVVKPKKRGSSLNKLQRATAAPSAPPSVGMPPRSKDKFFEDLPMTAKLRPGLRHGSKSLSSPAANAPFGPPQSASSTTDAASLVAPEREVPRYGGLDQAVPMAVRSPGDVKIKTVKDVTPLAERLSKFPGPLKGKAKKKETVAWLTSGIEGLEQGLSASLSSHAHTSHDAKREAERLLLWKILRVLVEHDGLLEGNPDVERAVRAVLSPSAAGGATSPAYTIGASLSSTSPPLTVAQPVQADTVDSAAMEQIRQHLSNGEREKAVWAAADKRLWGHAMLIANTWSPALYRQVAQEFVKKEVNLPGRNSESLAALYEVLSGNHEDSVDELVPVHARAGLQLVAKDSPSGVSTDGMAGLDKWRETLGLILSNRSPEDARAINSLGCLLAGYGRAEAAHICFIFSRSRTVFGGLDDPQSHLVLVGSDHKRQSEQFAKEIEPLLLSEVYEYGLGLASSSSIAVACPHLAPYKFQHALALAEYGYRDKALQYCDAIANAITAQTKRSPYHHYVLEAAVDDLTKRLKLAPKEDSGSWISKPSMTKVSDSVWNRFTQFVAGDEDEHAGQRSPKDGGIESGPFARVAGGTPTISRSPSVANLEGLGAANAGVPGHPSGPAALAHGSSAFGPPPQPATQASSRYAPSAARPTGANPYEPGPAYTKPNRSSSEMARPWQEMHPNAYPAAQPPSYGYEPPALTPYEPSSREKPVETANGSTFEPPSFPSYGYEPPSYQPDSEPTQTDDSGEECGTKPKKKGIMYDDDDGISAPNPATKNKEERDRENAEMFRKIAEEEAKRDAATKTTKKGWGFGTWFAGGSKKEAAAPADKASSTSSPIKPIRAKLGEANSFVYDPNLKRWVNKNASAEDGSAAAKSTPPPPRTSSSSSASLAAAPPRPAAATPPPTSSSRVPSPMGPPPSSRVATPASDGGGPPAWAAGGLVAGRPPSMMRSASAMSAASSRPPSRATPSLSATSSIDDLLAAGPKRPGAKKSRKSGRYVDVMAKP